MVGLAGRRDGSGRSALPRCAFPPTTADHPDDLDHSRRRRRAAVWVGSLAAALLVTLPLGVSMGAAAIPPATVIRILGHHLVGLPQTGTWANAEDAIGWEIRVPRVLLGVIVGAGLAVSGMALQAMARNVLADPYLLGVTSGASTGAAAALLFGVGTGFGASTLSVSAFAGALAGAAAVFVIARTGGRITSIRLMLAGVAVGYILYAATSFLVFASSSAEGARSVLFWLLGSLTLASWPLLAAAAPAVVLALAVLMMWGRRFDALAIGDDTALTLGVPPSRFRAQALLVVALCVGAMVAVSGSIGFIGLVVPHLARRCVGGSHRLALPVAALIGAGLLVWADVLARVVLQPQELPIGIVTAALGAPFLLVLIRRFHSAST